MWRRVLAVLPFALLVACGTKAPTPTDVEDEGDDDGGASSSGGAAGAIGAGGAAADAGLATATSGVNQVGCNKAEELVYVVDVENTLHAFDPSSLTFTTVGTLRCSTSATPNSMAVDRSGTAWVNYSDGNVYKVSIADASCQPSGFVPNQAGLGINYGMAFAANSSGSTDETLYIIGSESETAGRGLGILDTTTLKVTPVADFTNGLQGHAGELTGTGDARLFGFFAVNPDAALAQITPSTAATPSPMTLTGVNTGNAFAFSFWGGDFWFYTADNGVGTSNVTQLKASSDNSISVVLQNVGFVIVGAGVSTCAPTIPVR